MATPDKKPWGKRAWIAVFLLLGTGLAVGLLKLLFVDIVVDFWWFQSLGMTVFYVLRMVYRYAVFAAFGLVFFLIFVGNFWIASRFVGFDVNSGEKKALLRFLHEGLRKVYVPLSFLLALPIAWPLFRHWEAALQFVFAPAGGTSDPLFGKDISFYLFSLPIYNLLQKELLIVFVVLFLAVVFLYAYEHRLLAARDQDLAAGAKVHISVLLLGLFFLYAWGFWLERYRLVYTTSHQPLFFGPGFAEMRVVLPLIWMTVAFLLATGVSLVVCIHREKGWKYPIVFGMLFVASALGRNAGALTDAVQKFVVKPNELVRETPYIEADIRSTLAAYGLDRVEIRDYRTRPNPSLNASDPDLIRRLRNIPVWDQEMLGGVYEELQGIRTYYTFPSVDVDRYVVKGNDRQVYLGAREIDPGKLPESAQNWINLHLQYTHGQGVVMTPAAQAGDEFMTWFIKDIPPRSDFGLQISQSAIYYGLGAMPYIIAPNDTGEIGSPSGDSDAIVNYDGNGGIPVHALWRRLLFSLHFNDRNILFTTKTHAQSRILFRRNIVEKIGRITPFLLLDQDPYLVVTPEGLFWIQDAYTTSANYPMAPHFREGVNYIRNSVKIVVDAYHGATTYYVSDPTDPIVTAYRRMYPGHFQPLERMPDSLRSHIRYPKDLFLAQMSIYAKYQQTDPERYFRQEDFWEFSKTAQGRSLAPARPYYLTLDLIDPGKEEFLLFMPMAPYGRENLRALVVAGSDGQNYGKLFSFRFPRDQQVYGPSQIHSLINQDTVISEQFTLWDQEGSEVILGKMVIEPYGGSLLYIQPVYLQEQGALKIPQLKRLIMALEDSVVMAASLEDAAVMLQAELERKRLRWEKRFAPEPREPRDQRPPAAPPMPEPGPEAETDPPGHVETATPEPSPQEGATGVEQGGTER